MAAATLTAIHKFFASNCNYSLAKFRSDWTALTDEDKEQIKQGIGNETLTY